MNLRAQALLLTGFLAALKIQELNEEEQKLVSATLNTPEALEFLMLTAAAHRRTKTLEFLSKLPASSKSVEQWVKSQTISNIFMQEFNTAIPTFDAVFGAAISSDEAGYIEFLATAISVEVSAIIIAKLIALPAETKLNLKKIQAIVVALNEDVQGIIAYRDNVSRFVQAIVTGDLAYICGEVSGKFDIQYQAYFVLLAASHQKAPALRSLVEHRQFPIVAVEQWVQGVAISMPDYCPVKIETDCKTALLKAVQAGDLAYLRQMKPFLNPKLCALLQSESVQVDLTLAATAADNADMLEFLTKELACVLVEKEYDWSREGVREVERTEYPSHKYYEPRPQPVVKKETIYPDASDSLPYRHALLAAANKEKLKALAWLLNQSFKDKDYLIARCHAMTHDRHRFCEKRPNLKAFFVARQKQCLIDMSSLPLEEIKFYIDSLTSGDELVSAFVAACELGEKELVLASLGQLNNRIWYDKYNIGWSIDKQDAKHQQKYAERKKIQEENPFDQWLMREYIEPMFLRSDPRIPRLLNTEFEKFAPEYGSQSHFSGSLRRSLQALRVEHQKIVRITAIKNTFCESLQLSDEDQAFLAQALSTTKYVNHFKLVRPIFESTLKNDNLPVFYAVFLPAKKDDDARELASCYVESWYGNGASTCLVEAARADAVNIFRALHTEFGNHLLTREVRRQLRTICDDGKHPNIKSTLESVLAVTVVQQSIFSGSRTQEAASVVLEKKM